MGKKYGRDNAYLSSVAAILGPAKPLSEEDVRGLGEEQTMLIRPTVLMHDKMFFDALRIRKRL